HVLFLRRPAILLFAAISLQLTVVRAERSQSVGENAVVGRVLGVLKLFLRTGLGEMDLPVIHLPQSIGTVDFIPIILDVYNKAVGQHGTRPPGGEPAALV